MTTCAFLADVPGGFYGKWVRRTPPESAPVADLTTLKQRCRDGQFEAFVELIETQGLTSVREVVDLLYPTGTGCGAVTFEHICSALEFIETYPKEKA